ncbi:MAG: polysaccharide biosynthesis protein [Chryseolinea sp.]
MIEEIYKRVWQLSPSVGQRDSYTALNNLTQQLIQLYDQQGRLDEDPFNPTRLRKLSLPVDQIKRELKNKTCVVTGGLGCVGSTLLQELLSFELDTIVVLDIASPPASVIASNVIYVKCDVRDFSAVTTIFKKYKPEFVFHTAAQRDPGYAELHIYETVSSNVIGTLNIVKACEESGTVKQCVFSSTGKASRYFTQEVYAGTKKMCEFILDVYARKSTVRYCMVRFTHILDNSLMNQQLMGECEHDDFIAVHCPGKFVTAQNVTEAAYLMLNTLVYAEDKQCNFLLVRNLEWPVESLEMALYYIKRASKSIPVIFMGNPVGYTEKFFRGQMDWSNPQELNLLINVYEQRYRRYNQDNDIIISHIAPVNENILTKALDRICSATSEHDSKTSLIAGIKALVRDSLNHVDKHDTVNILNWGLQQRYLEIEKAKMSDYGEIIPMMFESLERSEYYSQVERLLYQKV